MIETIEKESVYNENPQNEDVLNTFVEVELKSPGQFNQIVETLTRMGITCNAKKQLFQSCHILKKFGRYYIVHFKELYALDGKRSSFSETDKARRNLIACLLEEWGFLKIVNLYEIGEIGTPNLIRVIPYRDKHEWELITKYDMKPIPPEEDTNDVE